MPRSMNPKTEVLAPVRVTPEQGKEIRRRAEAARLTLADYMRDRALGKVCPPVKQANDVKVDAEEGE